MGSAWVETALDIERDDWAVVTLHGEFVDEAAVAILGKALVEQLSLGRWNVAVTLSPTPALCVGACRTLIEAAAVFSRANGYLVACSSGAAAAEAVRSVDLEHDLLVVGPP